MQLNVSIRTKAIISIVFVSMVGAVLYLLFSADPPGYCRERSRFLSDEEFIETAVRNEVNGGMMRIDGTEPSIRAFHVNHPSCCRVKRERGSLFERMIRVNAVTVDMYYEVNEKTLKARPLGGGYYEVHATIDACGRVGDWAGTRIEKRFLPIGYE
jgi:hypothetical protein